MQYLQLNPYNYEWIERVLKTIQMADESTNLLPLGQVSEIPRLNKQTNKQMTV